MFQFELAGKFLCQLTKIHIFVLKKDVDNCQIKNTKHVNLEVGGAVLP